MKTIKCTICGKTFQSNRNAITCSVECQKERRKEKLAEYREVERSEKINTRNRLKKENRNLDKTIHEARESGMSYGKYIAMKNSYLL